MERVIVTGGCGAIGSEVINRLQAKYPNTKFHNIDKLTYAGNPKHIEAPFENYTLTVGDICDADLIYTVISCVKPTHIIHLAAETHVDNSFGNSFAFSRTNILGTHVMLECTKRYINAYPGIFKRFIHMSTDEVYGSVEESQPACDENSLCLPSNPYSASKAASRF